jgi:hypothetical protein
MKCALVLPLVVALACSEHEPELKRVGGPELDASSDAMPSQTGSGASDEIAWCQALTVIETVCQRCHQDPPLNGAPVPFMTYEDTQAQWFNTDFKAWERMQKAVATDFMPATFTAIEPPVEPLTCEQKTTLLGWLEQGARDVGGVNCTDADKTLVECGLAGAGGAPSVGGAGGAGP